MLHLGFAILLLVSAQLTGQNPSKEIRQLVDRDAAGSMSARADLAWHYFTGGSVRQDKAMAWRLIGEAINAEDSHAYYISSTMWLLDSTKGSKDYRDRKASEALARAAEMGHTGACFEVGNCFAHGFLDFPQNRVLAYKWIALGLDKQNSPRYRELLAELEQEMTKQQVAQAIRLSSEKKGSAIRLPDAPRTYLQVMKAAQSGDAEAQHEVGMSYKFGRNTEPDQAKAVAWFSRSAAQGHPRSKANLGFHLVYGVGTSADLERGTKLILEAASSGDQIGAMLAGELYLKGIGVSRDRAKAYQWHLVAEKMGSSSSSVAVDQLERVLAPAEIARGQELATALLELVAARPQVASNTRSISSEYLGGTRSRIGAIIDAAGRFKDPTIFILAGATLLFAVLVAANPREFKGRK